ncbi:MAG: hypothetical protein QM813_06735 [Verrucomicrobiota bacterium]
MKRHIQARWLFVIGLILLPAIGRSEVMTPLPTVEEVIKRAVERGKLEDENDQKFKEQYYFVRHRKTEIRNAKGDIKKLKIRVSTNAPIAIAVAPEVTVLSDVIALNENKPAQTPAEMPRKLNKKDIELNLGLVERFDFKLVERVLTNGSSLLVVDFAPKKTKLPEKGLQDRVVNRMAGRLWLDERDYAIQKCAVNLTESISIVGGIVGEAKKFSYGFERERTEDGLWYVRASSWHLEGRQVVVHREADYHEERTEVRKYVPVQRASAD